MGEATIVQTPTAEEQDSNQTGNEEESKDWFLCNLLPTPDQDQDGADQGKGETQHPGLSFQENAEISKAI